MKRTYVVTLLAIASLFASTSANGAIWKYKKALQPLVLEEFQPEEFVDVNYTSEEPMCANPNLKQAKVVKAANNKGYAVYIGNKQAIWFTKDLATISAHERAQIVADNINRILAQGTDPASIRPIKDGNNTYLRAGSENLVTVDEINAKSVGVSVHELAYTWANGTRTALGASPLRKDYADISRGYMGRESRYLGHVMTGMASWYGPTFHGKRAADGSRFNTDEYTAAHKTYPFGTLVKVTNLRTNKSCVVKITDRGPYAHGRIIDLSKKAAEDIGMLGSGVAKVKLEVVGQY